MSAGGKRPWRSRWPRCCRARSRCQAAGALAAADDVPQPATPAAARRSSLLRVGVPSGAEERAHDRPEGVARMRVILRGGERGRAGHATESTSTRASARNSGAKLRTSGAAVGLTRTDHPHRHGEFGRAVIGAPSGRCLPCRSGSRARRGGGVTFDHVELAAQAVFGDGVPPRLTMVTSGSSAAPSAASAAARGSVRGLRVAGRRPARRRPATGRSGAAHDVLRKMLQF